MKNLLESNFEEFHQKEMLLLEVSEKDKKKNSQKNLNSKKEFEDEEESEDPVLKGRRTAYIDKETEEDNPETKKLLEKDNQPVTKRRIVSERDEKIDQIRGETL